MSSENNIQKIEEALKTSKVWRFENATLDFDVNINKEEYPLESVLYVLANVDGYINYSLNDIMIHWQFPRCGLFRIVYELRENKLRAEIYRIHRKANIKIVLLIDVEKGSIFVDLITLFEP